MAKKKIPSMEDALNDFKSIMLRASLSDYLHVNGILISKNPKDVSVIIKPDKSLFQKILDDLELKDHITELDESNSEEYKYIEYIKYTDESNKELWIDINCDDLYAGKVISISVNGFNYEVSVNKNSVPLKLRKAEFNNISYRIFTNPKLILTLAKRFDGYVDDSSFTMFRLYQIL